MNRHLEAGMSSLLACERPGVLTVIGAQCDVRPAIIVPRTNQVQFVPAARSVLGRPDATLVIAHQSLRVPKAARDDAVIERVEVDFDDLSVAGGGVRRKDALVYDAVVGEVTNRKIQPMRIDCQK